MNKLVVIPTSRRCHMTQPGASHVPMIWPRVLAAAQTKRRWLQTVHALAAPHERKHLVTNDCSISKTSHPYQPQVSYDAARGLACANDMRPCVGRSPNRPQKLAGTRTEPPVSLPSPTSAWPAATAAWHCRAAKACAGHAQSISAISGCDSARQMPPVTPVLPAAWLPRL
jgi:hypothetical protein